MSAQKFALAVLKAIAYRGRAESIQFRVHGNDVVIRVTSLVDSETSDYEVKTATGIAAMVRAIAGSQTSDHVLLVIKLGFAEMPAIVSATCEVDVDACRLMVGTLVSRLEQCQLKSTCHTGF